MPSSPRSRSTSQQLDGRGNRLLDALPARERKRLLDRFTIQQGDLKERLLDPGHRINHVYFPVTAVVSLLTTMDGNSGVEIATVGNEGMVGVPVFLGIRSLNDRDLAQVQVPGTVLSMSSRAFRDEASNGKAFRAVVERYVQAYLRQVSQQVACNALHPVAQRCARWILLTQDRVGGNHFPLTHEFLAQMLGVRRASVTVAIGALQGVDLVRFSRGQVTVLDRQGLEAEACQCYAIIAKEFDRLLGPERRRARR